MIMVKVERGANRRIRKFKVSGHAGYAERGYDIVCAGVSAVTVGTVNAIERLTGVIPHARMKDGFLSASLPDMADCEQSEQVQLLLEAMLVMLQSIEESYGSHIAIQQKNT